MGNRKALLIGVENYGEGFAPLPAVREDIKLIGGALEAVGYEAALCPPEVLANASKLDANMRAFCESGGPGDVRLIYFSGHGILVDNVRLGRPSRREAEGCSRKSEPARLDRPQQNRRRLEYGPRAVRHRCVPRSGRRSVDKGGS